MKQIRDLGKLDGDILLFGGPYSNLAATQALMQVAKARGIPPQFVICTGDIVAYCAEPEETIAVIADWGCHVVAGNTDVQLGQDADACGCGFAEGSSCDLRSARWYPRARGRVQEGQKAWLRGIPDALVFEHNMRRYVVIHGGAEDKARFLWSSTQAEQFEEEIFTIRRHLGPFDAVISGHSGIGFMRKIGAIDWMNAGVVGMPAHHGRSETQYMILSQKGAEIHALRYDYQRTQRMMQERGFTNGYEASLATGYWPSEEILPPDLRRALSQN